MGDSFETGYLRFLSTDGSLIPVSAGTEVFLFCSHNLLKGTNIWSVGENGKHFKNKFPYIFGKVLHKIAANTVSVEE